MDMISTGRAAATVNNVAAVEQYMTERPDVKVKIAAVYEPAEGDEWVIESAAMFRKQDQSLCNKVSEIIQEMIEDGTCYDLTVKYFGQSVADSTSIYQK
ncbi:MAG: transporter substrate-binding domain-containing protein [Clostridia bacterium]|nr:transporter substrate-binding domain-containing protein [Clostridia bacterium]